MKTIRVYTLASLFIAIVFTSCGDDLLGVKDCSTIGLLLNIQHTVDSADGKDRKL